jgi:hypothetical protein
MKKSDKGIIQIIPEYARGYDLKLLTEAKVFIVANGGGLSKNDVLQMLGRGSRAQSKPEGFLFIQTTGHSTKDEAF